MASIAVSSETHGDRVEAVGDAEVRVNTPDFAELRPLPGAGAGTSLDRLADVSVMATAELGHSKLTIAEVLLLEVGSVVALDRPTSQPVDLVVQGVKVARGEVTVVGDHFAIRITEITNTKKRSGLARAALGKHTG